MNLRTVSESSTTITSFRADAEKMTGNVIEHGWDGDWFLRAYDHYGNPVGSAANPEGQVFIEPQGMCIMGGIGVGNGVATRALASVRERLATPPGILPLQPQFREYRDPSALAPFVVLGLRARDTQPVAFPVDICPRERQHFAGAA